jgi:CBS domain containing-hemolysin-like protein
MSDDNQKGKTITKRLKKIFKRKDNGDVRGHIEDLIESEEKHFSEHEQLLLNNILYIKNKKCSSAMVPRAEILSFHKDGTVQELANLMVTKGHSRIPVYGDSLDDILGIAHIIELAKHLLNGNGETKVEDIISRDVKLIPPTMSVLDLLRNMQSSKIHMAIVVDEYGGVEGIVTIEDLLEEIVGDIEDEYDLEEQPIIVHQDKHLIITDAKAELEELRDVTKLDLYEEVEREDLDIDTIGGYVFHIAHRIPAKDEVIDGPNGLKFRILDVDPRRIKKIAIILPNEENEKVKRN